MKFIRLITLSRSIDVDEYEILMLIGEYHNIQLGFFVDNTENILVPDYIMYRYLPSGCGVHLYINQIAYQLRYSRAFIFGEFENKYMKKYPEFTSFTTETVLDIIRNYTYLVNPIIDESYISCIYSKIRYKFND